MILICFFYCVCKLSGYCTHLGLELDFVWYIGKQMGPVLNQNNLKNFCKTKTLQVKVISTLGQLIIPKSVGFLIKTTLYKKKNYDAVDRMRVQHTNTETIANLAKQKSWTLNIFASVSSSSLLSHSAIS